jgi:hypothetical protein
MSIMDELIAREQYWLKAYESGEHVPGSNLDRCLREGLSSVRRAAFAAGPDAVIVHRKMANDFVAYLSNLFENLTGIVDTKMYESSASDLREWGQCLWVIPRLVDCFTGKGYPEADLYDGENFGLRGFPSRKYLENHIYWQSSSLERILIHHLLVWETIQYGPAAFSTQISIWDQLAQIVAPRKAKQGDTSLSLIGLGAQPLKTDSLSKLQALFRWTTVVRAILYFSMLFLIATIGMLSGSANEIVRQVSLWIVIPSSLCMIVWTVGSVIGWTVHPLLFRKSIEKRRQPLVLLNKMSRLGDKFLKFTSPKEAEHEMIQTRADGAVWPNDCWALLYLSINRGDAFWGGELQNKPFYKRQLDQPSSKPKAKGDGLINLLETLNGRGALDENGEYHDYPPLDY